MDVALLRERFAVLENTAYLNAGTDGPVAGAAIDAAEEELRAQLAIGRTAAHFERNSELKSQLRERYAGLLQADVQDVSLTTCTTEGMAAVVGGLGLVAGDEILTSDEEHPGLLGALAAARERGVTVREVPLARIGLEVGPATRLLACSHVSWLCGRRAPDLADCPVPVLLDGAQGVGAVPVDVRALGCDAYAGAGQKWLCGPDGTGMLYTTPELRSRLSVDRRGYGNMANPGDGLAARLHDDARRFDALGLNRETLAFALAAFDTLAQAGWTALHERAAALAEHFCELLGAAGRTVAAREPGTLVAFTSDDPPAERASLAAAGVVLRDVPGRPWLRASVGAWNNERDAQRLVEALAG